MKSRFSTLDIKAALKEVHDNLLGNYVLNIYDIDSKTYLIKLKKCASKHILLIESGARVHPTEMEWPKSAAPSGFSMKLRKHLKGKRLTAARQLGFDRIIDLQFGYSGCEDEYHLIVELYDRGNIVLVDQEYTILNLLRQRTDKTTDERFAVRETYPVEAAKELTPPFASVDEFIDALQGAVVPEETEEKQKGKGKKKKKQKHTVIKTLNGILGYGTDIIEHFMIEHDLDPSISTADEAEDDAEMFVEMVDACYKYLLSSDTPFSGYITATSAQESAQFIDFTPVCFAQIENDHIINFDRFSLAVDHFYGQLQTQKSEQKMIQAEKTALKKLENVKLDHLKRLDNLKTMQESNVNKAQLIEMNLELVDAALNQVRSAVSSQIAWEEIEEFLTEAQEEGDPVACAIRELKFKTNQIVVFLAEPDWDDPDDSDSEISDTEIENRKASRVALDLGLSAFGNAKNYYDSKKAAVQKESKTIDASKKAFKSAEKKTLESLKQIEVVRQVSKVRKQLWFEKFLWFISSENYLVIAGHNAQDNEIIVKRHLRPGDAYVHADIHGASSCIVKNPDRDTPISPVTLHEVGHAAVCHSVAWEAKVVTSAWWVHANQVSKTAPSGEFLTTGSFMIRGKKNYLPPSPLVMGFAFLFKLDDACVARHAGERKIRGLANEIIDRSDMVEHVDDEEDDEPAEDGSESSDDDDSSSEKFPDTNIAMNYEGELPDQEVIYLGDDKPIIVKFKEPDQNRQDQKEKKTRGKPAWAIEKEAKIDESRKKRGKAGKEKKRKEKYSEQDEEDRERAMAFLGSAGVKKERKVGAKELRNRTGRTCRQDRSQKKPKVPKNQKTNVFQRANEELAPPEEFIESEVKVEPQPLMPVAPDSDEEDEIAKLLEEEGFRLEDVGLLDSLTGKPGEDDLVHFAIPVVAPFSCVRDYKYNVKMVPGTGKKGKSAKMAISLFAHQKDATQTELDLMKVPKDEELTRNMPGKIKLAGAKNLPKGKKRF